jgi:hypothetical protein
MMTLLTQAIWLFVLAIPIACISWTVTHEELFHELHEWCVSKSKTCGTVIQRKFFYLFTCEYCFSHYVTIFFLIVTRYTLLLSGWRGYLSAGFSLVAIANLYMTIFGRLRLESKHERIGIEADEALIPKSKQPQPK